MTQTTVTIRNRAGIHARPSALLAQKAMRFSSRIWLEKAGDRINAKSIMGILTLGACFGTPIVILAEGSDEAKAVDALRVLFDTGFNEQLGE